MIALSLALALVAEPLLGVVVVPRPEVALPKLAARLEWAKLVEPSLDPRQLRSRLEGLVDPFDVRSLAEAGVKTRAPMRVFVDPDLRVLVLDLELDRPEAFDRLTRAVLGRPGAMRFSPPGPDASGAIVGGPSTHALAVARVGRRGVVHLGRGASPGGRARPASAEPGAPTELAREADGATDPRLAHVRYVLAASPLALERRGDLVVFVPLAGGRRATGGVFLDPRIRVELDVELGLADETSLSVALDTTGGASIFAESFARGAPVRLSARLAKGAAKSLFANAALANGLDRDFELLVSPEGHLYAAARLAKGAGAPLAEDLRRDVLARLRGPDVVARVEDGVVVLHTAAAPAPKLAAGPRAKSPLRLALDPPAMLAAFESVGLKLGRTSLEILSAKVLAAPLLLATSAATVEVRPAPGKLRIEAEIATLPR